MEATHDGLLKRLHHEGPNIEICRRGIDGVRCRIQRVRTASSAEVLYCPSKFVSKGHCAIYRKNKAYWIKDLTSTNGTYLNGTKIVAEKERELRFGDIIGIGVSHEETDLNIPVQNHEYYIYEFKKGDIKMEVVNLDDDDRNTKTSVHFDKHKKRNRDERKFIKPIGTGEEDEDSGDIEIVEEVDTSVTAARISSEKGKPREQLKASDPSKVHDNICSSDMHQIAKKVPVFPFPHGSSSMRRNSLVIDDSQKVIEPERKRIKRYSTSSSDDSSDGLGDVDLPTNSLVSAPSNKGIPPSTYSLVSSSTSSSSDAEDNDNEFQQSSAEWAKISSMSIKAPPRNPPDVLVRKGTSISKPRKSSPTARKSTCPTPHEKEEKRRRKQNVMLEKIRRQNEMLKKKAEQNLFSLKLTRIIDMERGSLVLNRMVPEMFSMVVLQKIQQQFYKSMRKNGMSVTKPQGFSSVTKGILKDFSIKVRKEKEDLLPLSPSSSSDFEDLRGKPKKTKTVYKRIRESLETSDSEPENPTDKQKNATNSLDAKMDVDIASNSDLEEFQINPDKTDNKPIPEPIPSTSTARTGSSNRKVQLINNSQAPTPRFATIAQSKAAAAVGFKNVIPSSSSSFRKKDDQQTRNIAEKDRLRLPVGDPGQSVANLRKDEKDVIRKQLLRNIEMKKQHDKEKEGAAYTSKKSKPTAKIKLTKRNRNQLLTEDIAGKDFMDTQSVIGGFDDINNDDEGDNEKKNEGESKGQEQNVSNQKEAELNVHEIPILDPRLRKKTEENMNLPSTSIKVPTSVETRPVAAEPLFRTPLQRRTAPPPPIINNGGSSSKISLLKAGAEVSYSPVAGIGKVTNKEAFLGKSSSSYSSRTGLVKMKLRGDDDFYKKLFAWRPAWIEEQKKMKDHPPVVDRMSSVTSTLTNYVNFEAYLNVYYNLLLLETWGTLISEVSGKGRNNTPWPYKMLEYPIKIDDISRPGYCHLIKHKMQHTRNFHPDEQWVIISYHTWVKSKTDIDTKKELVQLTFTGTDKTANTKKSKSYFGYAEFNRRFDPVVEGKDCDPRLKKKIDPNCKEKGYRFMETVVFRFGSNTVVHREELAHIKRLCYFGSKIREFRALNDLQSFPLFEQIVSPAEVVENCWKSPEKQIIKSPSLIKCCMELNTEQISMVNFVNERVFSGKPDLMLMHGPPGTGKTRTLIALVLQILITSFKKFPTSENNRILICTPSNAAIDEIMRRLIIAVSELPDNGRKIDIVRFGEGYAASLENYSVNAKVKFRDEEESTIKSLKAELTSVEVELEEVDKGLEKLKNIKADPIAIASKANYRQELITKRKQLNQDLHLVGNTRDTKDVDIKRQTVIRSANIICTTLTSGGNSFMKNTFAKIISSGQRPFLCCLIDEASQTTEPETLLPLVLNIDKLVLVGDPEQLGATVLSTLAGEKGYGQSMFSRLYKFYNRTASNPVMMLKRQYRMNKDIVSWPNSFFYGGKLQTSYQPPPANFPLRPYYFINMSSGKERSEGEGRFENDDEKLLVTSLLMSLEEILLVTKTSWSVGIITPYAAQKAGLQRDVQHKTFRCLQHIEVDTVDGFQGQEKDIIILSCVRTDATGFLKSRNRLNVALTRAKHCLYIIGDARCLSQDDMWRCLIQDAAVRNCKFEVKPNFKVDLTLLRNELNPKLKERW